MRALAVAGLLIATDAHAIVGGVPSTDPSVVALVRGEGAATELVCSGTLVGAHAVLTAAHCLVGTDLPELVIAGERTRVIAAFVAPGFDATTFANDVAIALFDRTGASTATPAPRALSMTVAPIGATIDLVGFGRTSPSDTTPFAQRTGTATITESSPSGIVSRGPSFTCEGDSGGPALVDGLVVGVTSSGDDACMEHTRHTRISDHLAFIDEAIARTRPADVGGRCFYPTQCSGECTPALDDSRLSFCTVACPGDTCPGELACVDDRCRHPAPSPGALGSSCETDDACIDALCVAPERGGDRVCAPRCFTDLPGFTCADRATCEPDAEGGEACFVTPEDTGCCSSSRSPSSTPVVVSLLVLAGLARRTRAVQLLRGRGRP
ncbi:MAG: S1 family peptidase [Kofleriaceae bacterium]